jgi:hypothetical protein
LAGRWLLRVRLMNLRRERRVWLLILTRVRRARLLTLRWVDRVRLLRRPGIPGSPGRPALDLVLALRRSHLRGVSPRQASHDDHADDPEEKPEREPVTPGPCTSRCGPR